MDLAEPARSFDTAEREKFPGHKSLSRFGAQRLSHRRSGCKQARNENSQPRNHLDFPRLASPRYGLVARGILKVHAGLTAAAVCAILATVAGWAPALSAVDAGETPADFAKSSARAGYQLGGIFGGTRRFRRDARLHRRCFIPPRSLL